MTDARQARETASRAWSSEKRIEALEERLAAAEKEIDRLKACSCGLKDGHLLTCRIWSDRMSVL